MKKFLIVGFGNLGQRHCKNLQILYPNCEISTLRFIKENILVTNDLERCKIDSLKNFYNIKEEFYSVEEVLNKRFDLVLICTPPKQTLYLAFRFVRNGFPLFVEKPLSDTTQGLWEVEYQLLKNKTPFTVGYQMKYHPILVELFKTLKQEDLGKILSVHVEHSSFMPNWFKNSDYRKHYASRKDLGGGVLNCQVHELNYIQWLFGQDIKVLGVIGGKYGDLEIDVEDNVDTFLEVVFKKSKFPLHLHLDFLGKKTKRTIEIITEKTRIMVDLVLNSLYREDSPNKFCSFNRFDRNDLFKDELMNFMNYIENKSYFEDQITTFKEAKFDLNLINEIKMKGDLL